MKDFTSFYEDSTGNLYVVLEIDKSRLGKIEFLEHELQI